MKNTTLEQVAIEQKQADRAYHEFLRVPSMSAGLYLLPAGAVDPQTPHTEDELYYIVRGRASILIGDSDLPVEPGSLVFVEAGVEHRFHDITEELAVLVLFAPAEYSHRTINPL